MTIGHNTVAGKTLLGFVERIERLNDDKREIADQIGGVKAEAKAHGYDVRTLMRVIAERKKKPQEREEQLSLFDLYWHAIHGADDETDDPD